MQKVVINLDKLTETILILHSLQPNIIITQLCIIYQVNAYIKVFQTFKLGRRQDNLTPT